MQITPESKTINEIFSVESTRKYKVPEYQRNYSWAEENVEELVNDINNEDEGYYIGNILVINNSGVYELVDGQQRLTSLILIFIAILQRLNEIHEDALSDNQKEKYYSLKMDIKRKLKFESTGELKLQLLDQDALYLKGIVEKCINPNSTVEPDGRRLMVKRYTSIVEWIRENLGSDFEKIIKFYQKVNHLELLQIIVDELVDAFSIFSSLNGKGLPLSLLDLLKVQYLERAEAVEGYSDKQWLEFTKIFEDEDGEVNVNKATQFLLNHYDTFIGNTASSITKKSALKTYKDHLKKVGCQYIDTLLISAQMFSDIVDVASDMRNPNTYSEKVVALLEQLSRLDIASTYPLLMAYFAGFKDDPALRGIKNVTEEELIEVLGLVKKFYIRRNIVLKPKASNIRGKVLDLIRRLYGDDFNNSEKRLDEIRKTFKTMGVNDIDFTNALKESVYDSSAKTVRIMLIDLERAHEGFFSKQREDTLDNYVIKGKGRKVYRWTLEHILPEGNLNDEWSEMISPEDPTLASKVRDEVVHKLGNLTLTAYNSELSNNSFLSKRNYKKDNASHEYLGLRSGLYLNQSIPAENETIEEKTTWTPEDINRRTESLVKEVIKLYEI